MEPSHLASHDTSATCSVSTVFNEANDQAGRRITPAQDALFRCSQIPRIQNDRGSVIRIQSPLSCLGHESLVDIQTSNLPGLAQDVDSGQVADICVSFQGTARDMMRRTKHISCPLKRGPVLPIRGQRASFSTLITSCPYCIHI